MKTEKIRNLVPKHINKKAFIHTPEYLPKLHGLFVVAGSRGSGKTHSCTNVIRFYKQEGLCDRVLIISPTGISNKIFYSDIINDEQDIITSTESESIGHIVEIVEQEAADYESFKHIKNLYTTWQKLQRKKNFDINAIDPELLLDFDQYHIWDMLEPPKWKYENDNRAPVGDAYPADLRIYSNS